MADQFTPGEQERICPDCRYPVLGAHYPDCATWRSGEQERERPFRFPQWWVDGQLGRPEQLRELANDLIAARVALVGERDSLQAQLTETRRERDHERGKYEMVSTSHGEALTQLGELQAQLDAAREAVKAHRDTIDEATRFDVWSKDRDDIDNDLYNVLETPGRRRTPPT